MSWLSGGVTGFLNPWVWLAVGASFVSGVGYEAYQAHVRQTAREAVSEYVYQQEEARTAARISRDKRAQEQADAEAQEKLSEIHRKLDSLDAAGRLLTARIKTLPGRSVVSSLPGAAGRSPTASVCFLTGRLDSGMVDSTGQLRRELAENLGRLRQGARPIVERGAAEAAIAGICSRWAVGRFKE